MCHLVLTSKFTPTTSHMLISIALIPKLNEVMDSSSEIGVRSTGCSRIPAATPRPWRCCADGARHLACFKAICFALMLGAYCQPIPPPGACAEPWHDGGQPAFDRQARHRTGPHLAEGLAPVLHGGHIEIAGAPQ